jgi:16S rRNA (guanine966-N2)-methyltransferase
MFNVLGQSVVGAKVLDLFSGTGSLGIESLSRGARFVYFIDNSYESINLIKTNLIGLKDIEDKYRIIKVDVVKFLTVFKEQDVDIIFLDPPFKIIEDTMIDVFDTILEKKVASEKTVIVYEYFSKRDISKEFKDYKVLKNSFFGDKIVTYLSI